MWNELKSLFVDKISRGHYTVYTQNFCIQFSAQLFSEKTSGIAIALVLLLLSLRCKNFDILEYVCYYRKYLLETQNMCSLSEEQSILSSETIQNIFFSQNYAPFSTLTFYPFFLFSINHPTAERWYLHAVLLF